MVLGGFGVCWVVMLDFRVYLVFVDFWGGGSWVVMPDCRVYLASLQAILVVLGGRWVGMHDCWVYLASA